MSNDKSQNLPKTERAPGEWYEAKMAGDQGLIINELTGENIAITYKKENAAFIVKACNLHGELVEMLQDARLTVEVELANLDGSDYEDTLEDIELRKEFFDKIDALIAKAQEPNPCNP